MRRLLRLLVSALVLIGCSEGGHHAASKGPDSGPTCIDEDHDGFGQNCALGADCDDHNPSSTNQCRVCAHPEGGCPCARGQQPIACFAPDQALADGNVMCHEGTRYCRDGLWSQCESIHDYVVTPDRSLSALINPDAAPENCSICDVKCFKVTDPLLTVDGGPGTGVSYAAGGGLQLAPADGGTGGMDGGGDGGTLTGCTGLAACCMNALAGSPQAQSDCNAVVAQMNDPQCNAALQLYCPTTISGPVAGCVIGANPLDTDCDGIPDSLDECTPATVATNPACQGSTLPLTGTNNQTIFHILAKGQTGSDSLQIGFKVQNADVYFLMDMTGTMNGERDNLVAAMTGKPNPINVVECALLKNCCDRQSGATQTACMNVVTADNTANCTTAEATYCTGANAGLVNCPDLDFDGLPDNQLKTQGVVGAVRCLVGSAWFGTGLFRELPFSGLGDRDENGFRHYVDMTPNVDRIRDAISTYVTDSNFDYPEADMVGLYSVLTGKGAVFGNQSVNVAERLGLGCPAGAYGYPCFRNGTIPIVVLFTDDPLHNGPPTYTSGTAYAASYALNGTGPSSGGVRFTPVQAESFATAYNLGSVNNQFIIADGNLAYMTGDYPAAVTGCGAATTAPDAVYRFTVDPILNAAGIPVGTPVSVPIAINVYPDPNGWNAPVAPDGPTPATTTPVVVSLYRGIPTTVQQPINVGDTRVNPIPSGPDLTYLTYIGTSSGKNSAPGFLGGISGCSADGKTNEVVFTFRPTVDAKIVIDSSQSGFNSTVSLHQGLPKTLPANPSGASQVALVGAAGNNNDTFSTARNLDGSGGLIDGQYVTYVGDMVALQNTGTGSAYNLPGGKSGTDDYDSSVVACGVNSLGPDAVYRFDVGTPRRVRIDTEGSNFKTVISLHDGAPPQSFLETNIGGNGGLSTLKRVGSLSGDTVTDAFYAERSDSSGTGPLGDSVAPVCGAIATTSSQDAYYSFQLTKPTHLNLAAAPRTFTATPGEAYNTPGAANEAVSTITPPSSLPPLPLINEFVAHDTRGDQYQFVEVFGQPNTDYSAYKILQVQGNSGTSPSIGAVIKVIGIGNTDSSGLWVSPFLHNQLVGNTFTLLLVSNYTGNVSTDIDANDDGLIDSPAPWTAIIDSVGVNDGTSGDVNYGSAPVLTNNFDGTNAVVNGASRIPSGKDTDSPSDWVRNDFDGDGLPGFGFDPLVFLYSSPPGSVTTINAADPNGDGNTSDSNSNDVAASALNLGDVFGQVDTKVINADLSNGNVHDDYPIGVVTCNGYPTTISAISTNTVTLTAISGYTPKPSDVLGNNNNLTAITAVASGTSVTVANGSLLTTGAAMLYPGPGGNKDQVYKFTPSADGTIRVNTTSSGSSYTAVAIYDGPPPISGTIGVTQLFDASKLSPTPDTSCTAYSFDSNKGDGVPPHVYWFCTNSRTWTQAETNCGLVGGHLARLDDATENGFVGSHRTGTPAWVGGHDTGSQQWHWSDNNDQFWQGLASGSVVGGRFTSFRSGQPATANYCIEYKSTSAADTNNWDAVSCTGSAQFACEVSAPAVAPPEGPASAYAVGTDKGANGDLYGHVFAYTGSTRRMDYDVDGTLMPGCGATQQSADAVFKIKPSQTIQATIDTSGSAFPAIVGLFDTAIDNAPGHYLGCDAPGVAPNSDVTASSTPASPLPLGGTTGIALQNGHTYYAVIKGTASSPDGAYQIKFTDLSVTAGNGGNGTQIACSKETVTTPAAAQADFSANHTYYVMVESDQVVGSPYAMVAHSLYRARNQIENPLDQNEHGGTALSIADPYRSKDTVVNTSTAGMAANFTTTGDTMGGQLSCGASSASPDAVYKFTPSIATNLKLSVNMPGQQPVVALFKGQPGSQPTVTDLGASGNTNENSSTAYSVSVSGAAQTLLGNTSTMTNDIDGSLVSCGAAVTARDAVFRFNVAQTSQIQIDASASSNMSMMGDPVIGLFHDFALERPPAQTVENDNYTDANSNPNPTPTVTNNWLTYQADMADLTAATQSEVSIAATNTNEQVNPTTLMGALDLGDVWNTKVTVGGANTTAMQADYLATGWCGGDDNAPDAIYSFHTSQANPATGKATVRISTAKPTPGFNTVIALFDGSTGAPLRKVDSLSNVVNLNVPPGCGNSLLDWDEQCDDGNNTSGDGCSSTCQQETGVWRCPAGYYGAGDGCDCGCGLPDPDCMGATASSACDYCETTVAPGGCVADSNQQFDCAIGLINPTDNTRCLPAVCGNGILEPGEQCDDGNTTPGDGCDASCRWQADGVWHCPAAYYGTNNGCDCGCGIVDPDCANANASSCLFCGDTGSCGNSTCPGAINPTNNATCTSFHGGGTSNSNDRIGQAQSVDLAAGGTREFLGNTAGLAHDVPATQVQCGAATNAPDAVYQFTLRKATQVQIDASASTNKPVLALFNSAALSVAPPIQNVEPDNPSDADVNPSPTPQIQGNWVRYSGNLDDLTVSAEPQVTVNNQDNQNNDTPTELYDPIGRRDTVTNADTSAASVQATYPSPTCAPGADTAHDELYRFVPSASGQVRISTNYPQTGMNPVIALYDGSAGGPPLTRAQGTTVTVAVGNANETQSNAQPVPFGTGAGYLETGTTSGMASDVSASYFQQGGASCNAAAGSSDAVFAFSLSKPTDVEINSQGSSYNAVLGLFDSPFVRPSVTQLDSLPDSITQVYDIDHLPGEPDAGCSPYDYNLHRYWFCSQKRTWDGARAKCQAAGWDLIVINDQTENDEMLGQINATAESHLIGLKETTPYTSWGAAPAGVWVDGSGASYRNWYANEPNQPADSSAARMRYQDGQWVDVPETWQTYRYICEQNGQPALPQPPTATNPQLSDVFGASRHFVGSTKGMASTVGNLIGCGAQAAAPDAVFRFDLAFSATVSVDFGNSFAGSVIGLFKGSIGPQGYIDAGNTCAMVTAAAPQFSLTNLAAGTYYVVLTANTAAGAGSYEIKFTGTSADPAAFTMENDKLVDAINNPIGDITNRWVVKTANMAHMTTDLISSRNYVMAGQDTNDSHVAPYAVADLGSTSGEQINVTEASLNGLSSDYPAPSCGLATNSVDAIYKFTPTRNAPFRISVAPTGFNSVVALYRGPDYPLLQSEAPTPPVTLPNTNEKPTASGAGSAVDLGVVNNPAIYLGNVGAMVNDVPTVDAAGRPWDTSDLNGGDAGNACNAAPTGSDAFFKFTVSSAGQKVVVDSTGTSFAHTLAVWRSTDLVMAPASSVGQYDTRAAAPNLPIDNQWYVLTGDTTNLMPGGDSKVTKTAGTDFTNDDMTEDLGTLAANTQIVTSGADSSAAGVHSDFDIATLTCGAAPSANDMVFKFHTNATGGPVELAVSNPSPGFPPVLALFDGTGGKTPQTASGSTPSPTPVTGNNSQPNAYNMPALGAMAVAYSGDTSNAVQFPSDSQAASLYNQAAIYGGATCSAGPTSKDAFFKLTLASDAHVRIQPQTSTAYAHTIAIYDSTTPLSMPATPTTYGYDTYALAAAAPTVTIDKNWVHYTTTMAPGSFGIGELGAERFFVAGTDFQNSAGVQDLAAIAGTISAKQFRTKASSSYAGGADTTYSGASYPAPACGGVTGANDMIWKVTPTTNTKLRVGIDNPALVGFNPMIAVYDGRPLNVFEVSPNPTDLHAGGDLNETFATAQAVSVGARALYLGNESAMMSNYAGTQFQAFVNGGAPKCNPSASGPDAFLQLNVRTIPDSAMQYAQLWLDADDASTLVLSSGVQTWRDKSGLSTPNHLNQSTAANRPTTVSGSLNGRTGVDFNGTNQWLASNVLGSALTGARSVFVVWKLKTGYVAASPALSTDSTTSPSGFTLQTSAASPNGKLQYLGIDVDATINDINTPMIAEVVHDSTSATPYKNGTAGAASLAALSQYDIFRLGENKAGTAFTPMTVYEVLVFSKALSTAERQTVEGYLANKWGLTGNLPAGHPYKAAAPTRNIEVSSASTNFAQTIAYFTSIPMSKPTATAGTAYDTSDLALASPLGPVNGTWYVRNATTAGLHISELTQSSGTAGGDGTTAQSLGGVSSHEVTVSGGSATTASYAADFPRFSDTTAGSPACGSSDNSPDAVYSFTATASTGVHIALKNPNFAGDIGLFDGSTGAPLTNSSLGLYAASTALGASNETVATAQSVTFPTAPSGGSYTGVSAGYTGDPATSNVNGAVFDLASAPGTCTPDTTTNGQDAFFKFTIPSGSPHQIDIDTNGTGGNHTLSIFDKDPTYGNKPAATSGTWASNVDTTSITFPSTVWNCPNSGTTTVDSAAGTVTTTCTADAASVYTTNNVAQTASGGPNIMLIKLTSMTVPSGHTVSLVGDKPIVFVVNGAVTIGGVIDASASGTTAGAGGNWSCGTSAGGNGSGNTAVNNGASGGGGGAFGTGGGTGGGANSDNINCCTQPAGGTAGLARGTGTLSPLMGGCAGGQAGGCATAGAAGGGAIQISAKNGLTVTGTVRANGGAGATPCGSTTEGGGTGGGSGGGILLEGASVTTTGSTIQSNGGNGGKNGTSCSIWGCGGTNGGIGSTSSGSAGGNGTTDQAGAPGAGGGYGRIYSRVVVSSPVYEKDTAALATASPYAASNAAWTVKTADWTHLNAEWAVPSTLTEASFSGFGEDGTSPINFGDSSSKRISIDGDMSGANRHDSHDEVCGADGGPDAVYSFTPTVTGKLRVKVTPNGALTPQLASPIVAMYNGVRKITYQKQITLDHTQVSAALTNFPILIKTTDANLASHAAANGSDIYFLASDLTTMLDFEIDSYTSATGALAAWVRIPNLSNAADTVIYMRYGDAGADRSNQTGVWDSSFQGVWHLSNNDLTDSTSNARNGTNSSTADVAAQISTGRSFTWSGNNAYVAPGGSQIANGTDYTLTTWANINTSGASNGTPYELIADSQTGLNPNGLEMNVGSSGAMGYYNGSGFVFGSVSMPSNSWAYIVERVHAASSGGYVEYSVNGGAFAQVFSGNTSGEGQTATSVLRLGHWAGNILGVTYGLTGSLDEVHISTTLRSNAWVAAEYANQKTGSTFVKSIGAETQGLPVTFLSTALETCVTDNNSANLAGAQTGTDSDGTANSVTVNDLNVTAGKTYYLVVKRGDGSATVAGDYLLELTWKDPSTAWASCAEEMYDGKDGYFAFTTGSGGSARQYTIETQGSTGEASLALYSSAGSFLACNAQTAGQTGTAQIQYTLSPNTTYYVMARQPTGGATTGIVNLGVRDDTNYQLTTPTAIACADGTSGTGYASISTMLAPGTYYVGWKGGKGGGSPVTYTGAYQVNFRDHQYIPAHATQVSCSSTASGGIASIDATVQSGRTYYVIVKGDTAAASGTYALDVADSGAVPSMSCAGKIAAPGAPDGYHAFSVAGSNKDVTVDLTGSTLDSVYELWQDNGASDVKIGCAATSGSTTTITSQLAPGNYYVKVRGTSAMGNTGEQPFTASIRDDDVQRATDCADGASSSGTTLTKALAAGSYYIGIKPQSGQSGSGYQLAVRDTAYSLSGGSQAGCTTNKTLDVSVTANHDYYVLVKGQTASDKGAYGLTVTDIGALDTTASSYDTRTDIGCGADLSAPDAYYEFTVASVPKNVEVSIVNGFNGAFQLYRDSGSFSAANAVLGCSTGTQNYNITTAGKYYVLVKGRSVTAAAAEQPVEISIRDRDSQGSIACADGNSATPAVLQSNLLPSAVINASGQLKAGTYYVAFTGQTGQNGPYALQFNDQDQSAGSAAPVIECTTSQSMTHTLAANTDYYAVVKGNGPPNQGPFTLSVTDVSNVQALDASCPTDLAAPDGFAAFTLTGGPRNIRVDMSGSSLTGAFQVFTNAGAAVAGCGCSSISAPITCNLASGSYYVAYRGSILAGGNAQRPYKLVLQDASALGSVACADGSSGGGVVLTTPALAAGTYYAGVIPTKTNSSTNYAYRLSFKDSNSAVTAGATEVGCNDREIDATVAANTPYYVIVKGKNSGDQGDYGLTVQDLSGVPSFGCGDDTSSGDAFYSFTVTNSAGSNVTIDTQNSMLQTVVALFPSTANFSADNRNNATQICCSPVNAGQPTGACNPVASCDGKPDDLIACDANSGIGGSSLINGIHLAQGTYYIVVRGRQGAPSNTLPYVLSVRDDDGVPSTFCSAASGGTPAQIRRVLQPGTYWAVIKGGATSPTAGAYTLRFRDDAVISKAATEIACDKVSDTLYTNVTAGNPYYVVVKGETAGQQGPYKLTVENLQLATGMGCNADLQSPDAFYRFSVAAPTDVSIDTSGSAVDTVIALYNIGQTYYGTNYALDGYGVTINCNDDAPEATAAGQHWSKIRAHLAAGSYYLEVKAAQGAGASWGAMSEPYQVSIRDEGASSNIACAPASSPAMTQTLPPGDYKLVVSSPSTGGNYDVKFKDLSAVTASATRIDCDTANDTIVHDVLPNNQYYVIVKGDGSAAAKGAYTLTVETADSGATSMGCGADPMAADAFFKFHVAQQTDVTVDTIGSQLDTVLAIYPGNATVFGTNYTKDAFGTVLNCDNDGGGGTASKIAGTLAPGDYYAVVKGTNASWGQSSLPFNLSIRDNSATRAIACANSSSGPTITQTLDPGSYLVVLDDTTPIGSAGSGGAYSITFKNLSTASQENGMQIGCALGTLDNGGSGVPVLAGQDYYVIVKGNTATDSGPYTLNVEDMVSSQASAGSTPIACAATGDSVDGIYPAGNYYALVTGPTNTHGTYELSVKDVDPFLDYNRLACDKDSGPNSTSVVEANLQPGPHYVVVKGDGPGQTGTYQLNVRDMTANPDNRIACASPAQSDRIEADVKAGQDYTVLLKGDERLAQGNFNIKLYDELGLSNNNGQMLQCQTICPSMAPYNSCKPLNDSCSSGGQCCSGSCSSGKCTGTDPATSQACASSQLTTTSFTKSLAPDTYYLTVKGRRATEKGFYELQIGDSTKGSTAKYVPPQWTEVRDALVQTGVKVLPVVSCTPGSNGGRCDGTSSQTKAIAQVSGAIDKTTGQGMTQFINPNGTGIGSGLAMAVRDLANYLAMDITLAVVGNPGFQINIQKCTNAADSSQSACIAFSQGCNDTSPVPKNTIAQCQPGATPKFLVQFTNPLDPNAVPPNPSDPNGGYHFKLQIVGNHQYLLDEIPVYIIPTNQMGPPPPTPGSGNYTSSGSYTQQVYGAGCNYYQLEGEGATPNSCSDGIDNNTNGKVDSMDPGCQPGSCLDGIDNDGDGKTDINDPDCATTETQDWTDLFFHADIPPGTNISFDVCTGDTSAEVATCSFSHIATVTSVSGSCATNADCKNVNVNGTATDGFCGTGGQCQFITPRKQSGYCLSDADCPNGNLNGETVTSHCVTSKNQCQYTTPPADIGGNLMMGQNGKPYARVRITLNANSDMSASPTLYEWWLQYICQNTN